jgi:hypothetical protein
MKSRLCLSVLLAALALAQWVSSASAAGLERLYVFYCGTQVGKDQAL